MLPFFPVNKDVCVSNRRS